MNILDAYIKDNQRLQEAEEWDISNQKRILNYSPKSNAESFR